jgi:hypothetical protein
MLRASARGHGSLGLAHSLLTRAARVTPYISIQSAEKQSGKSLCLQLLSNESIKKHLAVTGKAPAEPKIINKDTGCNTVTDSAVIPETLPNPHGQSDKSLEELPGVYRIQPQKFSEK